jgi:hypothetical protein
VNVVVRVSQSLIKLLDLSRPVDESPRAPRKLLGYRSGLRARPVEMDTARDVPGLDDVSGRP